MIANGTAETTGAPRRYHALDGLRAAMMFLGIVLHAVLPYLPGEGASDLPFRDKGAVNGLYGLVIVVIHSFRMPVFFVMAGFFAALLRERRGGRELLVNRFRRIVLPFAVGWAVFFPLIEGTGVFLRAGGGADGLREAVNGLFAGRLYRNPNPTYLWFLYYLAFLYPVALALSVALRRFGPGVRGRIHAGFRRALGGSVRPVLFALPTALTLWPMAAGGFDTPMSFRPSPTILGAYAVFFGFGWLLYAHADLLSTFPRHAWKQVGLAALLLPLHGFAAIVLLMTMADRDPATRLLAALSGALVVWLLVFGLIGLFVRYFDRPNDRLRYATDASYWCYLAHFPVLFWVAAALAPLPLPSPVKVLAVVVLTTALILAVYHVGVRSTFLGAWLNGRRYPRRRPPTEEPEPEPRRPAGADPLVDDVRRAAGEAAG